ncbi:uncharacterized protein [Euwallacea fornicatus]|uniref:uncharacterized protein n=1 Tax=Euwallacea fornicatus TaxID=995702 RepID=UPI00338F2B24
MLAVKGIITFTFVLHVSSTVAAPWVYNAPRALFDLASSASASASAPITAASYITDFRRQSAKVTQLQEEKDGIDPFPEENDEELNGENANEASPNLFHKKIGKILTKLRLIAQIKNAYHNRSEKNDESMKDTNSTNIKNDTKPVPTSSVNITILEHIQQIPTTPKKSPKAEAETPIEVNLEIDQINKDKLVTNKKNEKLKEQEPSRLGSLGIFFVELLGSIVGLTYGAVAQIAAGGQSPVTVSTSEGL